MRVENKTITRQRTDTFVGIFTASFVSVTAVTIMLSMLIASKTFEYEQNAIINSGFSTKTTCKPVPILPMGYLKKAEWDRSAINSSMNLVSTLDNRIGELSTMSGFGNYFESVNALNSLENYKKDLVYLARENPNKALDSILQTTELDKYTIDCLPKKIIDLRGTIHKEISETRNKEILEERVVLVDNNGTRHWLHIGEMTNEISNNSLVIIKDGYIINDQQDETEIIVAAIAQEDPIAPAKGIYRTILLKAQPRGLPPPKSQGREQEIANIIFESDSEFFRENSYNTMELSGMNGPGGISDIYPESGSYILDLPLRCSLNPLKDCSLEACEADEGECQHTCSNVEITNELIQTAGQEINLADADIIIGLLPEELECLWGGHCKL